MPNKTECNIPRVSLYAQFLDPNFRELEYGTVSDEKTCSVDEYQDLDEFIERIKEIPFDVAKVEFLGEPEYDDEGNFDADSGSLFSKGMKKSEILWYLGDPSGHI